MLLADWHLPLWADLLASPRGLPHALLLGGPEGLGKRVFAQILAARLLCENAGTEPEAPPCGSCSSCLWLAAGNHPDFRLVQAEEAGSESDAEEGADTAVVPSPTRRAGQGQVRVDQIRGLEDFVFLGSHRQGNRVALISEAETMNKNAANALLKMLEEPPPSVYFILISSHWRRLLPTLLSRCRSVIFGLPDRSVAKKWLHGQGRADAAELLDLASGIPMIAVDWADQGRLEAYKKLIASLTEKSADPVAMASKWAAMVKTGQEFALPQLVEAVQRWVFDLGLLKLSGQCRYHGAWRDQLGAIAGKISISALLACYNDLLKIRAVVRHPLNPQLFLEDMAARYLRVLVPSRS